MIGWTREVKELATLALTRFPDLNESEFKVVVAATSGELAHCGPSRSDADPVNDPGSAAAWGPEREIHADLIRWLCIDLDAALWIDPHGLLIRAARISGQLDLSFAVVRFPLLLAHCRVAEEVSLHNAQLEDLSLLGTHVSGFAADGMGVRGAVNLRGGFRADGEVRLLGADIGGNLDCENGKFVNPGGKALSADGAKVTGDVVLRNGFRAEGSTRLLGADIGGDLEFSSAEFARGSRVDIERANVKGAFFWRGLEATVKPVLNLSHASVGGIGDDAKSWPASGNLNLDGFEYTRFGAGPTDAKSRLEWLGRQSANKFVPQPYRQLAKVLREAGDTVGTRRVLVAMENERRKHGKLNWRSWLWQWVLKLTIGYGYRPWYALYWGAGIVALGWFLFGYGYYDGAMTPTDKGAYKIFEKYSPKKHHGEPPPYYEEFSAPVYSLDTFLPIVNFGEEDRWRPNPHDGSEITRWGPTTGSLLRIWLWVQIGFGWLLTTLFVVGFTSAVRKD
jgi:hypothetical protein